MFGLFSSCSPQYRKTHSSRISSTPDQDTGSDSIRITTSVASTPDTPDIPDFRIKLRSNSVLLTPEKDTVDSISADHRKVFHTKKKRVHPPMLFLLFYDLFSFIDFIRSHTHYQHTGILTDR